jgi:hypothetical protein
MAGVEKREGNMSDDLRARRWPITARMHWTHFAYLWRHRWYVFVECCRLGIPLRGIVHDLSKFRPDEWWGPVGFLYGPANRRDETGYYSPTNTGDKVFDRAWFLHRQRNDHHWQYWAQPIDNGQMWLEEMSDGARREMLADWRGAGRAQGKTDTPAWYSAHRSLVHLAPITGLWVERQLEKGRTG